MKDFIEELNLKYGNKYNFLKLLSVVYDEKASICTITFLYPENIQTIPIENKEEIISFIKEKLKLYAEIKIKFKKSFLDEKLILNDLINFFKNNKKALYPYINLENLKISKENLNVNISVILNKDICSLIDEKELKKEIIEYLSQNYIGIFKIIFLENNELLPNEIKAPNVITINSNRKRYNVEIIKKIIGTDILPKPEYIKDNLLFKQSVILAGIITNKQQKVFTLKKGKKAGEEKTLFTFNLKDTSGNIDCLYFCGKTYLKVMENLPQESFILCLGNIDRDIYGKIVYKIKKISLAKPIELNPLNNRDENESKYVPVVLPQIFARETQENLFDVKPQYDDFILKNNIVVFDIETTGLDPETCEITEIGAVKISKGEIVEQFSSLVKPMNLIPEKVQKLTNITNEMVQDAPNIKQVIKDFYEWSKDCILSGYNIIGFDMKFLTKEGKKININFANEILDVMIVVRQSSLRVTNYKLSTITKALNISLIGAHRAYVDAIATAKVLLEMHRIKN